jgi:hypothetical protein
MFILYSYKAMAVVEGEIYSLGGYDNINNIYLARNNISYLKSHIFKRGSHLRCLQASLWFHVQCACFFSYLHMFV